MKTQRCLGPTLVGFPRLLLCAGVWFIWVFVLGAGFGLYGTIMLGHGAGDPFAVAGVALSFIVAWYTPEIFNYLAEDRRVFYERKAASVEYEKYMQIAEPGFDGSPQRDPGGLSRLLLQGLPLSIRFLAFTFVGVTLICGVIRLVLQAGDREMYRSYDPEKFRWKESAFDQAGGVPFGRSPIIAAIACREDQLKFALNIGPTQYLYSWASSGPSGQSWEKSAVYGYRRSMGSGTGTVTCNRSDFRAIWVPEYVYQREAGPFRPEKIQFSLRDEQKDGKPMDEVIDGRPSSKIVFMFEVLDLP